MSFYRVLEATLSDLPARCILMCPQPHFEFFMTEDETLEQIPLLCKYEHNANQIVLYSSNIYDQFKNAPTSDETSKLLAGIEISIAHAISTAIFFYFIKRLS